VFGLIFVVMSVLAVLLIIVAATSGSAVLIGVAIAIVVMAFLLAALIHAALAGIYSAALYRYAVGQEASTGFDGPLLARAFAIK
jgi:hypothetical protein